MDPELKFAPAGGAVLRMRIATTERWQDKGGERQERTEWHTVVFFGARAEGLCRHLGKGQTVYVEGRLKTTSYEKEGVKHYSTDVVAETVQYLGGGAGGRSEDGGGGEHDQSNWGGRSGGNSGGRSSGGGGGRSKGRGTTDDQSGGYDNYIPDPADDDIPF
jgi:single-strand DNA-binding protein